MAVRSTAGEHWSDREIDLIVADYFAMRDMDLAGQPYVKSQRNAELQRLTGRSRGSIEFKHRNISAVLLILGLPWIRGYAPLMNFQKALLDGVERFLDAGKGQSFELPRDRHSLAENEPIFIEPAPHIVEPREDLDPALARLVRKFDPAARDDRNRELGRSGEERVLREEDARLRAAGRDDLARKIKWVAQEDGDGAGYDIRSFSVSGEERFLEVKTTTGANTTPFFISRNEKAFSEERPDGFRIFRLYDFARKPRAFMIDPPLEQNLLLRMHNYRAGFR